jgi:hypothetical protein
LLNINWALVFFQYSVRYCKLKCFVIWRWNHAIFYNIFFPISCRDINTKLRINGHPVIKHTFDVWHMVKVNIYCNIFCSMYLLSKLHIYMFFFLFKAVTKDLYKATKLKLCPTLHLWIRSISNMLWWSVANCKGLLIYIFTVIKINYILVCHVFLFLKMPKQEKGSKSHILLS